MSGVVRGDDSARGPSQPGSELPALGTNLRRLRIRRGLSLERLAQRSGVSRAMLSQIELGHSAPTINLLWKVARALEVPFSALLNQPDERMPVVLPAREGKRLLNHEGTFSSRALFPFDERRKVEFYELRLQRGGEERAQAHAPGTMENLVVSVGTAEIAVDGVEHRLGPGDAILFNADVEHTYRNPGDKETLMYLVMVYPEPGR